MGVPDGGKIINNCILIDNAMKPLTQLIPKSNEKTLENLQTFIDPAMCGEQMIEEFLEEHRDIRLYKVRLEERGKDFLKENKRKMFEFFDNIEIRVTQKLKTNISQN